MLKITKQNNSIVVEGVNNYKYPDNAVLSFPLNSIICQVDESDIITFHSASNYDVLFSGNVDEITINGESVTKENVGDKFGSISNTTSGGGGLTPEQEEKLNNSVQIADYNADKEAQATIDDSQNASIEGLRGNIDSKQDKIDDLNAIREGANKGATALQNETDPIWTAEKGNYYTKSEVDTSLESKANKSEIPSLDGYATEQWVEGKGYLTEHQDISGKLDKTEAASTYQPKGDYLTEETDPIWNAEKGNYYTKTEVNASLETKANKSEIPTVPTNVSAFTNDAGYLTEHQSLSNYYTKSEVDAMIGNINNALATLING